jgi:acylglycerol lipase
VTNSRWTIYLTAFALVANLLYCCLLPANSAVRVIENSDLGKSVGVPISEWVNEGAKPKGIILAIHALLLSSGSYNEFAGHLASTGYKVYAPDIRGFGRWRNGKRGVSDHADFNAAKRDLERIVAKIREKNPDTPLVLLGESMGGDYVLWLLSEPIAKSVDAAIVCAPGFKFTFHPNRHVPIDAVLSVFHPRKQINFDPYLETYLAKNGEVTRNWRKDDTICRTFSLCELLHNRAMSRAAFKHVRRIPADFPILIMAGANDQVFNTNAIPKRLKHFGTQNLSVEILPDSGHLVLESQQVKPEIKAVVDAWLAQQIEQHGSVTKAEVSNSSSSSSSRN